jgi:8-oxo-dGTP pyrophosphatase MutT (NUDIX family)
MNLNAGALSNGQLGALSHVLRYLGQQSRAWSSRTALLGACSAATGAPELFVEAALTWLALFGALIEDEDGLRVRDPAGRWLALSLAGLAGLEQPVIGKWDRRTHAAQVDGQPDAAMWLRWFEQRRILASEAAGHTPEPLRMQGAAMLLIRHPDDPRLLLCQFDRPAGQWQLIGGKIEPDESPAQAALRELNEELGISQARPYAPGIDVAFLPAHPDDGPFTLDEPSLTYGVLTRYTLYVFHTRLTQQPELGSEDRWLPIDALLRGETADGERTGNPRLMNWLREQHQI